MSDRIPTGCAPLDDLLGGGFERGAVTQVYGPPAAGKTNIVLSAAVETAARGDAALYVDTEGLSVERMEQLAAARVDGGDGSLSGGGESPTGAGRPDGPGDAGQSGDRGVAAAATADDVDALASRLIVSEAHTFEEQEEAVRDVEEFVETVELVVLDSATGFYRLERTEQEEGEALRAVGRQLAHLLSLARKHDLAVAFTNQVFTDPESDRSRALGGHTLNHWSATVLRVERFRGGNRRATLEKHRSRAAGESARFRITGDGLAASDQQ
ncbi:MAG: AAA family ATPase [Haloarculaceae archaeon]